MLVREAHQQLVTFDFPSQDLLPQQSEKQQLKNKLGGPAEEIDYDHSKHTHLSLLNGTHNDNKNSNQTIFRDGPFAGDCQILIMQKTIDAHYEIFESVALKYPLPFASKPECQTTGLSPGNPIGVDFILPYNWRNHFEKKETMEAWGWQVYFESHLQGKVVPRHVDGRYIRYRHIRGDTEEDFEAIAPKIAKLVYSFSIEPSCDLWGAEYISKWLSKDTSYYCVLHSDQRTLPQQFINRSCNLNPQFENSNCWFLPTVYPKFPKLPVPMSTNSSEFRVCIGWKAARKKTVFRRDDEFLVHALKSLQPQNTKIVVIGRNAVMPPKFRQYRLKYLVEVEKNTKGFYDYQRIISNCHALIPLVHANDTEYFLGTSAQHEGRLSGMIAQVIGNQIASLVHERIFEIYSDEFTAPTFVYKDRETFEKALERLLLRYRVPMVGSSGPTQSAGETGSGIGSR